VECECVVMFVECEFTLYLNLVQYVLLFECELTS
jgi:hypothetical protein